MKKGSLLSFVLFSIITTGCASIHHGKIATEVGSNTPLDGDVDLAISASERTSYSSDYFGVVDFTFQNNTNEWINVDRINLDFADDVLNKEVGIVIASDLSLWSEGISNLKAVQDHNRRLLIGTIAGIAGGIAEISNSKGTQQLGTSVFLAGTTALAIDAYQGHMDKIQKSKLLPADHILSGPLRIPPGLFLRRWIVLYTKNPDLIPNMHQFHLKLRKDKKQTKNYQVAFRSEKTSSWSSNWQTKILTPELKACFEKKCSNICPQGPKKCKGRSNKSYEEIASCKETCRLEVRKTLNLN